MKKILSFLLCVATMIPCSAQYIFPDYINIRDFNTIKKYLHDSIEMLDPIEGIYDISLDRRMENVVTHSGFGPINYVFRCAIVRIDDNTFESIHENLSEMEGAEVFQFSRAGNGVYNVKMKYRGGVESPKQKLVLSRVSMETLMNFHLNAKVQYSNSNGYTTYINVFYDEYDFVKAYPSTSMYSTVAENSKPSTWSGTGLAIGNGYIVTNSHVASDAKNITIKGVKGDMNTGYSAKVVANDKTNDLAILKINDSLFKGYGAIPYMVSTRMADVGEDVFVLGYPLTQALGNEIKLTNGIVSSRTGYQGEVSTYQISAPVQPGNSGGPLFDNKGNVIGIVVAGVPGAENVGYAIKASYLKILIESAGLNIKLSANNTISNMSLAEKVKRVKNFVFYIECGK